MKAAARMFARMVAHAAARRIALLLVLAVLGYCGMGKAEAAQCASTAENCEQGVARALCEAQLGRVPAANIKPGTKPSCTGGTTSPTGTFECKYVLNASSSLTACNNYAGAGADEGWQFFYAQPCSARPSKASGYTSLSTVCSSSCAFTLSNITSTEQVQVPGSVDKNYSRGTWVPTGLSCAMTDPQTPVMPAPKQDYCADVEGGHKLCSDNTGKKCIVSATTGAKHCWQASESGPSTNPNRNEAFSKSPEGPAPGQPVTAPIARPDEDWQKTTQATIKNVTNNIVSNFAGFTNNGKPNTGGTPAPGDGSGNPSSGGGSGDGEGDGEGDEPGESGDGVGDLYEGSDKTMEQVMSNFFAAAQNTQMIGAAMTFMGNCTFGGSCPAWSYDGGEMMGALSFDLCGDVLAQVFVYCGYIIMSLGAFHAFRIAFY